jgi:hypothetical protein
MRAPDANDILRQRGPDALRAVADGAEAFNGQLPRCDGSDHNEEPPDSQLPLIQSSAQFVDGFIPPDYLIDGVLQRRFVYSFTARTGSGKTAILLTMAAHVGLGRAIGNSAVTKGRVLIFAGENPDDVRMRWIALSQNMDFNIGAIDVHFIPGTFKISQLIECVRVEAGAIGGVSFVIVDTSAAFFEGEEENSNVQQGVHARRLRGLVNLPGGPCVVVACHPTKNAADDNLTPRGGGAFIAEMDGNLTGIKDDMAVELHWQGKFRGPDFPPVTFMLRTVTHERLKDSKERLIPTVIASHLSQAGQEELAGISRSNEKQLLAAIAENEGASHADLARHLGWFMRKDGEPYKVKVRRVLKKLEKYKLVTVGHDGATLTDKGSKALK